MHEIADRIRESEALSHAVGEVGGSNPSQGVDEPD
jgi:hypothetical protein